MGKNVVSWITQPQQTAKSWLGSAGKAATTVGTFFNAPRLGPGGSAVGASLQNWAGQTNQSPFVWVKPAYAAETQPTTDPYANATKLPADYWTKKASTGGTTQQTTTQQLTTDIGQNNINQQVESYGSNIDRDYETSMTNLQAQEDVYRQQAGVATQGVETTAAGQRTALGNVQTQNLAGLAGEQATAQKSAGGALQQARDLYRQVQQQNIAQLSGMGISSSSVAEALAERLGVETARRVAGVTGSLDEVMQNISKERTRVTTYYQEQLVNLENSVAQTKQEIQMQLLSGIQQINAARNQAATEKANQRTTLWQNAQNALATLQQNAQNFAQTLQLWQTQKASGLTEAEKILKAQTTQMEALTKAGGAVQSIAGAGFTQTPQFLTDYFNQIYGTKLNTYPAANLSKKDELTNPFATTK